MNFEKIIHQIVSEFNLAWNSFQSEKIAPFLSESVVVSSPKIKMLYPNNVKSEITGKENVIRYWNKYKQKIGPISVKQISFEKKEEPSFVKMK